MKHRLLSQRMHADRGTKDVMLRTLQVYYPHSSNWYTLKINKSKTTVCPAFETLRQD